MVGIREVLQFLIEADSKNAIRAFDDVAAASKKSLGAAETTAAKWSAGLTKGGAAAVAAAGVASVGLFKLAQNAGQLELSAGRLEGIFEGSSASIIKFTKEANKIGLSDRAAAGFAASIGEAARGLGLTAKEAGDLTPQLIKIVTQLGLLSGMDTAAALETVNAAMRGEFDSLQRLVPSITAKAIADRAMTDAGKENAQQLTNQEKTMAALTLITEKGADTLDRSGNVMDSLAGKTAVAKANLDDAATAIGAGLLPFASEAVGVVGKLAGTFAGLAPETQRMLGTLAGIGTIALAAGGGIALIVGQVIKLSTALKTLQASQPVLGSIIGSVARMGLYAGGIYAVGTALSSLGESAETAPESINKLSLSLREFSENGKLTGVLAKQFGGGMDEIVDKAGRVQSALKDQSGYDSATEGAAHFVEGLTPLRNETTSAENDIDDLDKALADLAGKNPAKAAEAFGIISESLKESGLSAKQIEGIFNDYSLTVANASVATGDMADATRENAGAMGDAAGATGDAADAQGELADSTVDTEAAFKGLTEATKQYEGMAEIGEKRAESFADALERTTNLDDLISLSADAGDAMTKFSDSMKSLPHEIDNTKLALGGYNEKQREAIGTLLEAGEANQEYLGGLLAQGQTTEQVAGAANVLREAYTKQMTAAGLTTEQVAEYLRVLGLTPEQVETAIKLSGEEEARIKLELMQGQIDKLGEGATAEIIAKINSGDFVGAWETLMRETQAKANRNPVVVPVRPNWTGPQSFSGVPGVTAPAGAPKSAPAMAPMNVTVMMPAGVDGDAVVQALNRHARRNGSRNRGWQRQ